MESICHSGSCDLETKYFLETKFRVLPKCLNKLAYISHVQKLGKRNKKCYKLYQTTFFTSVVQKPPRKEAITDLMNIWLTPTYKMLRDYYH